MKRLLIKGGKLLLAICILASCTSWVNAAATLSVYDGVNPLITIVDNGPGDLMNGVSGVIQVSTNVGVWSSVTINSAETKPVVGSSLNPVLDLRMQANSTGAGSLRLVFSDNNFGPATGTWQAIVNGNLVSGSATTVTYDVYGDPANVVGATFVHIASAGTTALPTSANGSGPLVLAAPFSLTQVETFNAAGATSLTSEGSFQVIPEPGVMGLAAFGVAVLALGRKGSRP